MKSLAFVILLLLTSNLRADSVIMATEPEMVASADYIAVVEFQSAERGAFKGPAAYLKQKELVTRRFSRRVSARVIDNLKGKLPEEIQIYDWSGRWDALFQNHLDRSKSDSGRYLIFLAGNVDFLTGANGWASTSRITNEQIEWSIKPNFSDFKLMKLDEVLDRIQKQIEAK